MSLENLTVAAAEAELALLLARAAGEAAPDRLAAYRAYPPQAAFHAAGATHRERLFMAGNQLGKTTAGAMECALHATGRYPAWWRGRRFDRPTSGWAAGITRETTRDTVQRLLLGRPRGQGLGAIPESAILRTTHTYIPPDLVDTITVRHVSGGMSLIALKSSETRRAKWQGETLDWVWFDEEPPEDVYSEGLTRTTATGGLVFLTFTPLLGMSEVVRRFTEEPSPDRAVTTMTIEEAPHISEAERLRIVAAYPLHEREARSRGVPQLGSGRIFTVPEEAIAIPSFEIPRHWPLIGGIDFGWDHPTAAVRLAVDPDADCLYVTHAYRQREMTPVLHAATLRTWGDSLEWAWPMDGLQHDRASGLRLAELYRGHGLGLLRDHATFDDGSVSVEGGIFEMLERMQTGRWKVFSHLEDWFREYRVYHRRAGKVVKLGDDLLAASRYAMMMRRFARPAGGGGWSRKIVYDNRGIV